MGGVMKAISSIAGPLMNIASAFSPMGLIKKAIETAMSFAKTITGALKSVAPKAMEALDKKLDKAQDWATKATGQANNFLTQVAGGFQALGNAAAQFPPAAPAAAAALPPR